MNNNDNNYLLYLHMNSIDPRFIVEHAIIAGKLANREIKSIAGYICECTNQGVTVHMGGNVAKRFFRAIAIHSNVTSYSTYEEYIDACELDDVQAVYTRSSYNYIVKNKS